MNLDEWAARNNIPEKAIAELYAMAAGSDPNHKTGLSEAAVQSRIRLEASQKGARLWRNNVGACTTIDGSFIRFGLANESERENNSIKSADLIGLRPVRIMPRHIGGLIGQFVAREVKAGGWSYTNTPRETAQQRFLTIVNVLGGDGKFVNETGSFDNE